MICAKLRVKNGAKLNVQQNMLARGTGWLKKNARILPFHKNCCCLWTMPQNYKPFLLPPENWDSYANFEYRSISVLFRGLIYLKNKIGLWSRKFIFILARNSSCCPREASGHPNWSWRGTGMTLITPEKHSKAPTYPNWSTNFIIIYISTIYKIWNSSK